MDRVALMERSLGQALARRRKDHSRHEETFSWSWQRYATYRSMVSSRWIAHFFFGCWSRHLCGTCGWTISAVLLNLLVEEVDVPAFFRSRAKTAKVTRPSARRLGGCPKRLTSSCLGPRDAVLSALATSTATRLEFLSLATFGSGDSVALWLDGAGVVTLP